jgi:tetratricopeptide (TPR) repeat protein
LGAAYIHLGRSQEAVEALQQAIRINPNYAEARNNLGWAYVNLGRFRDAVQTLQQAIRLKSDYAEAYTNLGAAYRDLGRIRKQSKPTSRRFNSNRIWLKCITT